MAQKFYMEFNFTVNSRTIELGLYSCMDIARSHIPKNTLLGNVSCLKFICILTAKVSY